MQFTRLIDLYFTAAHNDNQLNPFSAFIDLLSSHSVFSNWFSSQVPSEDRNKPKITQRYFSFPPPFLKLGTELEDFYRVLAIEIQNKHTYSRAVQLTERRP